MPDVAVVGLWDTSYRNLHSSGYGCIFEKVARTDARGDYVLPDVSSDLSEFSRRAMTTSTSVATVTQSDASFGWRIVVFQAGLLRKGDLEKFGPRRSYAASLGFQVGFEWQGGFLPEVRQVGDYVQVAPIYVEKGDMLAPANELTYLSRIRQAMSCPSVAESMSTPSLEPILQAIAARARALACEVPPDQELSGENALEAARLIGGKAVFIYMQRAGEPKIPPWHAIDARALCDAARASDDAP